MKETTIVNPTSTRKPVPYRGKLSSTDYNTFQEGVVHEIHNLASSVNTLFNQLQRLAAVQYNEMAYLRRLVDALKNQQDYVEQVGGALGLLNTRLVDFSDTTGISYPGGLNDTYSAMIASEYGEATLPPMAIENRFYTTSSRSGRVITPDDLNVEVRSTFDKGEGDGLVNYEKGGLVSPGEPSLAFNGSNQKYWIRRVEFPIDSKVDDVEVELTVTVPNGASTQANLIEVVPFPNGSADVLELATSPDLSSSFTRVTGFTPTDNLVARRYHFTPISVERIRIRLRQRNWIEEDGKKVFYYGLQELGLKLIDYDRTYVPGAPYGSNNTFVVKIDAPDGYSFNQIYRIDPQPNFLTEDIGNRHVHLRLSSSQDFGGQIWSSDSSVPPQSSASPISAGSITTLYAIFELNYVDSSGGAGSPYAPGTTPYVKGLGLTFTLTET